MSPEGPNQLWKHPATWIAIAIMLSLFFLILFNILGLDNGKVLSSLAETTYARGLITYLFAVGTIGTAVVITVTALIDRESAKDRIESAKDVLALLVGTFGAIIGFYFGTEAAKSSTTDVIALSAIEGPDELAPGAPYKLSFAIGGGEPPYYYWVIASGQARSDTTDQKIVLVDMGAAQGTDDVHVSVVVRDQSGAAAFVDRDIRIRQSDH